MDAFIFDFDGTIANTANSVLYGIELSVRHFGKTMPDRETALTFLGPPLIESFQNAFGMSEADAQEALALYREYYTTEGILNCEIYEGMPELFRALRKRGKKVIIGTSKPEPFTHCIIEHFRMTDCFDFVAGSTLDGKRDAKKEVLAYALAQMRLSPENALMIGDRSHDVRGAAAVGLDCVGVLYGFGSEKELREANARYLVRDVRELSDLLFSL